MRAEFTTMPARIMYMPLPEGGADVWLRKNIVESEDEDGNVIFTADEVYIRISDSEEYVSEHFEDYFAGNLPAKPAYEIPITERLAAVEAAIIELAEEVANNG